MWAENVLRAYASTTSLGCRLQPNRQRRTILAHLCRNWLGNPIIQVCGHTSKAGDNCLGAAHKFKLGLKRTGTPSAKAATLAGDDHLQYDQFAIAEPSLVLEALYEI